MGLFTQDIMTFDDLFVHQLKDMFYAENQILRALPTMIKSASSQSLKDIFESDLRETRNQVERLKQVFRSHGREPEGVSCPAIDGIIEEANEVSSEVADNTVLDAALIASAQAVEHYEISRYGTLASWAERLGLPECARLLHQSLEEEKAADRKLTKLAEETINKRAA